MNDTLPRAAPPSSLQPAAPMPRIALIAAVARNGVIGDRNRLPWHLPEDLRRFRELTLGHSIIMGRKTWQSIGKPLPGRQNIVVTRQRDFPASGAQIAASLEDAIRLATQPEPVFVIGGESLYREALPLAQLLYITELDRDYDGDARFPAFAREPWRETSRETHAGSTGAAPKFAFTMHQRTAGS
ncbi:MAG: dihydrofolate reductase [Betaproteobacteria bacterium]